MAVRRPSKWIKLFNDFVKDVRIASKELVAEDERGSRLILWDSQRRFLDAVAEGLDDGVRIFYILKGRQLGITTISLLIDLFWLAMHKDLTMALVTDVEKNRESNRAVLRNYIASFPEGYFGDKFQIEKDNRQFMSFTNRSRIDFLVAGVTKKKGTASWSEGVGYAAAHLTEVAKYGDPSALASFEESFAQGNPNRLFIYESTASGYNFWRDIYLRGQADPITYKSTFCGWWSGNMNRVLRSDPRYLQFGGFPATGEERELSAAVAHLYGHRIDDEQLAWIRWKQANAPSSEQDLLEQNNPWTENQAFVETGYSFFQTREIGKEVKKCIDNEFGDYFYKPYRYQFGNDFRDMKLEALPLVEESIPFCELKIWQEPRDDAEYVIGADPAYGRNAHKDRHCASVWRCFADRLVQVAEFATSEVEVKHFAWVLAHIAGAYRNCIMNVEIDGPGRMIMQEFDHLRGWLNAEMNQQYVQARDWENALGNARWYLYNRPDSMGKGYAANFQTTMRTKQEIMHQMRGCFMTHELEIRSLRMLEEMRIVVQNGDEIGAPESSSEHSKDDRVFAAALAIRAWLNWRRPGLLSQGLTYERVMSDERGETSAKTRSLNGLVARFFLTMEERAKLGDERPDWRIDRGL
jgi:hypothetical protein